MHFPKTLFHALIVLASLVFATPALAVVDINTAPQAELETLPGIGPAKAAAIIEYRSAHGAFRTVDQLDDVPGIGPSTIANLRPLVAVGEAAPPSPPTGSTPRTPHPSAAGRVDINKAGAAELETLPGIGASKAAAIVADREANGPFATCSDLSRVKGIGAATVATIAPRCTTGRQ